MVAPQLVHAPHNGETSILPIFPTRQNKETLELAIVNEADEEHGERKYSSQFAAGTFGQVKRTNISG